MFTLYKPTKTNSGGAASFKIGQGGIFVEVLRQKTWDGKNGTFDTTDKCVVFLNDVEIASILRIIGKKNEKFSTVHVQKNGAQTSVGMTPWVDNDVLKGYGFSLGRDNTTWKVSLNLNETELFRQFLVWSLQECFKYKMNENIKSLNAAKQNSKPSIAL